MSVDLERMGWSVHFEGLFEPLKSAGFVPARIVREDRGAYLAAHAEGESVARVTGKLLHAAGSRRDFPAVGDWVALEVDPGGLESRIHALLPRSSCFSRAMAGRETEEQVIAANVDTALIVCGLDGDFNLRRIERYVAVAYNSGAFPIIVLNKMDLCDDVEAMVAEAQSVAPGVPVLAVSAVCRWGLDALEPYLEPGLTVAMLGSSGVGKSSLINCWLGEEHLEVQPVREDDSHGRHTTTHRELICLPQGGMVIDTPGMRELGLWADADGLQDGFHEIEALAEGCRFRDCDHGQEPGCAVREAIEQGLLSAARLDSYRKLKRELQRMDKRQARKARMADKGARKRKSQKDRRPSHDDD